MAEWNFADRSWRERSGDPRAMLKEALRRAVAIRDRNAEGKPLGGRPVMLVDVLNSAFDALGFEVGNLWSEAD
jgi:hypothetical protein